MSFDLINNILKKPWAIDPSYVEGITPFLISLLDGRPMNWERISSAMPYAIDARSSSPSNINAAAPGSIAVISMSGPLMKNDQYCGPVGTATINQWIKDADANVNIDGIILKVDSPGGTVDGTEEMARTIQGTKKPIVTYVDGLAASAAYWIGSSSDEVIANGKTAMIGSIGTMMKFGDIQPVLEKAGIKFHEIYASKSIDKNKAFRDATKDGNYTSLINEILDPLNEVFLSSVQKNRLGKLSDKENVLTGKTYIATEAKKYGLIDKIGSMDDAIKSIRVMADNKNKTRMSNAMKYSAVCALLGFENGFESTTEGVHLQEAHIEKINTALTTYNQLQADHTALQATATADANKVTILTQQVTALTEERDGLRAKADNLGRQSSGSGSSLVVEKDDNSNTTAKSKVPSYLDPNNPLNQEADKRQRRKTE